MRIEKTNEIRVQINLRISIYSVENLKNLKIEIFLFQMPNDQLIIPNAL